MTQVTANFIRNYRKHHCLDKQGRVYPGEEQRARLLLDVLQLAQRGRVDDAVELAYRIYGLDLEAAHNDFVALRLARFQRSREVWAAVNAGTEEINAGTSMLAAA
jgi:hypothetical protein